MISVTSGKLGLVKIQSLKFWDFRVRWLSSWPLRTVKFEQSGYTAYCEGVSIWTVKLLRQPSYSVNAKPFSAQILYIGLVFQEQNYATAGQDQSYATAISQLSKLNNIYASLNFLQDVNM